MKMWAVVFTVLYFGALNVHAAPEPKHDNVFNVTMTMVKVGVINMDLNAVCRAAGYVTPAELAAYTTTTEESVMKKNKSDSGKGIEPITTTKHYTKVEQTTTASPGSTIRTSDMLTTAATDEQSSIFTDGSTVSIHEPKTEATALTKVDGVSTTPTTADGATSSSDSTEEVTSTIAGEILSTTDSTIPVVASRTGTKTHSDVSTASSTTVSSEESRTSSVADKSTTLTEPTMESSFVSIHEPKTEATALTKVDGVSNTPTTADGATSSSDSTEEVTTSTIAGDILSTTDSTIPVVASRTGTKTHSDVSTASSTTVSSEESRTSSVADKSTTLAEPTMESSFVTPSPTIKDEAITPEITVIPKKTTTITPKKITMEESKPTTVTDSVTTTTEATSADKLGSGQQINYSVYGYLALSLLLAAIIIWISYMIYTRHQANSYVLPPPAPETTPLNHITTAA